MKLDRIILHIGSPKTGSSSIQLALRSVAGSLRLNGYLLAPYGPAHEFLESLFHPVPETLDLHQLNGRTNRASATAFNEACSKGLEEAIETYQPSTLVLSNERLVNIPDEALQDLAAYLRTLACKVEAYCYLREPMSQFIASQKQFVRSGVGRLNEPLLDRYFRASRQLPKFIDVFGPDLHVRPYKGSNIAGDDIVSDFFSWTKLPVAAPEQRIHSNTSLSHEALLLADALNSVQPLMIDGKVNPLRAKTRWLEELTGTDFQYPQTIVDPLEPTFEAERCYIKDTFDIVFPTPKQNRTASTIVEERWQEFTLVALADKLNQVILNAEGFDTERRHLEAQVFYKNGIIATLEGRLKEAVDSFGWCLEAWPEHRDCLKRLLETHIKLGDADRAVELAALYAAKFPNQAFYQNLPASLNIAGSYRQ